MRKLLAAVGAAVLASSLAATPALSQSAPAPAPSSAPAAPAESSVRDQVFRVDGQVIPVPQKDGVVTRDIVVPNTDGSGRPKVFIPKGFDAQAIPADLNQRAKEINTLPANPNSVSTASHDTHWAHEYAYSWGGLVQTVGRRTSWIYNRSYDGEEAHVYSFYQEINNGLIPAMESEQGIPRDWAPNQGYYDDDNNDGSCNIGGYSFGGYSFSVICTYGHGPINQACNDPNPGLLGCAWVIRPDQGHNGNDHQVSMFVKPWLSAPYLVRNVVWHEYGHSLSWGHNGTEPNESVMFATVPDWKYTRITYHDTWDLSQKYRHQPTS